MRNEKKIAKKLDGSKQSVVWHMLRRGNERTVSELFAAAYPNKTIPSTRIQQQYVGALISPINILLGMEDYRIVPGVTRRTYRLKSTI